VKHETSPRRKISLVNDLSPCVMMDEWSRFTSNVWVSGVSNVKNEKPPGRKSLKGRGGLKSNDITAFDVSWNER